MNNIYRALRESLMHAERQYNTIQYHCGLSTLNNNLTSCVSIYIINNSIRSVIYMLLFILKYTVNIVRLINTKISL